MPKKKINNKIKKESSPPKKVNRRFFYVAISVLVVLAFFYLSLKWIILGFVDQTPITRIEMYKLLEKKYGQELREQLIVEKLVLNEAVRRNVSMGEDEINGELKKIEEQFGGKEVFDSWLTQQRLTLDDLKKDIKLKSLVFKMFEGNIKITDEEINKYVEENRDQLMAQFNESTPNEEALKKEVREILKTQKITQEFRTWLENAKNSRILKL